MVTPEGQRPQELQPLNQFRIELPDVERLYDALHHTYQIEPGKFMVGFKIGTSHSEDELFSQINVNAMVVDNAPREGYSISAELLYQNPSYQYWTKEQIEQLQTSLSQNYGYGYIEHQVDNSYNSLIIKDFDAELLYVIGLGVGDERTAYKKQVEGVHQTLKDTSQPYYELIKLGAEQALFRLVNSPYPIPAPSDIFIKPIDADTYSIDQRDLFPPAVIDVFKNKTERWAKFIEDAVNAMAKVKGIPQSGRLTLLPPSEVPQM